MVGKNASGMDSDPQKNIYNTATTKNTYNITLLFCDDYFLSVIFGFCYKLN